MSIESFIKAVPFLVILLLFDTTVLLSSYTVTTAILVVVCNLVAIGLVFGFDRTSESVLRSEST